MGKRSAFEIQNDLSCRYVIRIYWWLEADSDIGGALGELDGLLDRKVQPKDAEDAEIWAVYQAAKASDGCQRDKYGLYWETHKAACKARAAADAALVAHRSGKPWPEWAIKAKAEGWKAPKGWTP